MLGISVDSSNVIDVGGAFRTPKFLSISKATATDHTLVSAVTGKKIRVLQYLLHSAGTNTITWKSGSTAISGAMAMAAQNVISPSYSKVGLIETASGEALVLTLSAAVQISGHLVYIEV